ncbi:MAG TPA: hypothetical protein VMR74_13860 [Gammaproteobacteria bacterium]|nr:hypothetical protein [Gammaproteobacteria bacterium]
MGFLERLEQTAYAQWILTSAVGWPLMLSLHALGLAIIVGVVFSLNLRMYGFFRVLPYTSLRGLMGIGWIGIILNIFTGVSVFLTRPVGYMASNPFRVKILCIVLGIVVLVYTRKMLAREAASWDASGAAPPIATWLATASLFFWIVAVVSGRLIAYIDYS